MMRRWLVHREVPSPNWNERKLPVTMVVLHYTGMETAQAALDRLCDPAAEVSAHYMIDEDGTVTGLVDEDKRAWHAGESFWRGQTNINARSIGIEISNPGGLSSAIHPKDFGTKSHSRNPLIFGLFVRIRLVEQVGSGIGRMKNAMQAAKLPLPEFSTDGIFTVTLKRATVEETV